MKPLPGPGVGHGASTVAAANKCQPLLFNASTMPYRRKIDQKRVKNECEKCNKKRESGEEKVRKRKKNARAIAF